MNRATMMRRNATRSRRDILSTELTDVDNAVLADVYGCSPDGVRGHLLKAVDVACAVDRSYERESVRAHCVAVYDLLAFAMVRADKAGEVKAQAMLDKIIRQRKRITTNG